MLAVLLCAAHFSRFEIARQPIITDVRFYLYFAQRVAAGEVPHRDFFDHKTQLATLTGALFHKMGEWAGVEPLMVIRGGYLALAGLAGMFMFVLFTRLGRGRVAVGLLGLLAYLAVPFLGVMPSIGNVPKMWVAVLASAAALAVHRRRWLLAGAAGGLAFMDWQIGAGVWAAVLLAALVHGPRRGRQALAALLGSALALAPFVLYFAAHGALRVTLRQLFAPSLDKATGHMMGQGLRYGRIWEVINEGCPDQRWIVWLAALGMLAWPLLWFRHHRDRIGPMLLTLGGYHYGLIAFCLLDFQRFGDLFILMHSIVFFAGLALIELASLPERFLSRARISSSDGAQTGSGRQWIRGVPVGVAAMLLLLNAGPIFAPRLELPSGQIKPGGTLAQQKDVAHRLLGEAGERQLAFIDYAELLFLERRRNVLPTVFWNDAPASYYRDAPDETPTDTIIRLLRQADADVVVGAKREVVAHPWFKQTYRAIQIVSSDGSYAVRADVRRAAASPDRP